MFYNLFYIKFYFIYNTVTARSSVKHLDNVDQEFNLEQK